MSVRTEFEKYFDEEIIDLLVLPKGGISGAHIKNMLQHAMHFKKLYKDMEKRYPQYCNYAAEELTEMANEWLEDCEDDSETATPITKKEFADRIRLKELTISPDGEIGLYFDDDDIFGGHYVIVDADINGEIFSADIIG